MQRLRRQLPFLRSVLQEANRSKRQDLLQHANADQINAVSELALNLLKNKIPVTPPILAKLRPYKKVLRDLGRRRHSAKKRRAFVSNEKDAGYFKVFTTCYLNVLNRPVNTPHVGASVTRRQSRNREMERQLSLLAA